MARANSTIVERLARAIAGIEDNQPLDPRWIDKARRGLTEIHEPTVEMYMAGGNAEPYDRKQTGRMRGRRIGDMPARDCWRLMIERALAEY